MQLSQQWGGQAPCLTFEQRQRLEADGLLGRGGEFVLVAFWQKETVISGKDVCLTLVQPVTEPVEDDVLFAGRHQADRAAAHRGAIVNVVLKDEDLKKIIEIKQKRNN